MNAQVVRVCVIGAGASGLCAARHLAAMTTVKATVFEMSDDVGGTWVYTDDVGNDKDGNPIHSSMYKAMRTNLPKEVMAFPDFPFQEQAASFLHHSLVLQYLNDYCDHFRLRPMIRFRTRVDHVKPMDQTPSRWSVRATDLNTKQPTEETYDYVIVCNGHYFRPYLPFIKGMEHFAGQVMHSHDYRTPEVMRSLRVAVLGAAASGLDISLEVATVANQVYLCHNKPPVRSSLPSNLAQVSGILECISPHGFLLRDGSKIQADFLLLCTGYDFSFPFLDDECGVTVVDRTVRPLFKHIVDTKHPSMAFLGIPTLVCPFPMFDMQAQWYCKVIGGQQVLPSEADMNADTEAERRLKETEGVPARHFHKMGERQWKYNDTLAEMARIPKVAAAVSALYDEVHRERIKDLMAYKDVQYCRNDEGHFVRRA